MSNLKPNIEDRLALLASADPTLVEPIRGALVSIAPRDPPSTTEAECCRPAEDWLTGDDPAPDAVILPCPPHGRMLDALLAILPKTSRVLVAERTAAAAARLFMECPLETFIRDDRVKLVIGDNEDRIDLALMLMVDLPKCPVIRVCDAWTGGVDWEFYRSLLLNIRTRVRMKTFNLSTVIHLGPQWQYNTLKNLPVIIRSPGIVRLDNLFEHRPAVIVAAGPSLDDALPHLKECASGFVVIAVGTALRSLRRAGIRPDLVITVDASRKTGAQFETPCEDLFLVSSMLAFPEVPPKFRGVFSGYVNANPIGRWLGQQGGDKGMILAAGTVTASAMDLAVRMGCNPILSLGLDLCTAADGRFHVNHSMYHGETKSGPELIPVPGNHRQTVFTTPQFFNYIEAIADYVSTRPQTLFLNATTDGARIQGMDTVLPHHLHRFARPGLNAYSVVAAAHSHYAPAHEAAAYVDKLRLVAQDLDRLHDEAVAAIRLCNRLMVALKQPAVAGTAEVRSHLDNIQAVERRILEAGECFSFIEMSLRPIHYAMGQKLKTGDNLMANGIEANRRSREFFEQVAGACRWTRQLLMDGIARIEKAAVARPEPEHQTLSEAVKQTA